MAPANDSLRVTPEVDATPLRIRFEEVIAEMIGARPAFFGTMLDIGCGPGDARFFFPGARYVGIDLDERPRRSSDGARFVRADALRLPMSSASVDAAVSIFALEFFHPPCAALVEMARVLKPGGRLFLAVPSPWAALYTTWPGRPLRLLGREWSLWGDPNEAFFTAAELRRLLCAAGFVPDEIRPVGGPLLLAVNAVYTFHRLLRGVARRAFGRRGPLMPPRPTAAAADAGELVRRGEERVAKASRVTRARAALFRFFLALDAPLPSRPTNAFVVAARRS